MSARDAKVCRFCGETDRLRLVTDGDPGETPWTYCAPWCGPTPTSEEIA
jgi:hypothetical protein